MIFAVNNLKSRHHASVVRVPEHGWPHFQFHPLKTFIINDAELMYENKGRGHVELCFSLKP